jgi:hypothetical protein
MSDNATVLSHFLLNLLLILTFFGLAILFTLTQHNTLKAIRPANRRLKPGLVWLQLIPFFNMYWLFHVVVRISQSAVKEKLAFRDDSILGIADDAATRHGKHPTLAMGISYAALWAIYFLHLFGPIQKDVTTVFVLVALAMIVCWIIYWVQLVQLKRKIVLAA